MFKDIDTVIFDMDGTLIDSMGMWGDIDRQFLADRNIPYVENIQLQIAGRSIVETAEFFREKFGIDDSVEDLIDQWNNMAMDQYRHKIPLKEGALTLLKYLKKKKIKMGIATSNSRDLVEACFSNHNLSDYIDVVVTADEVPHGKPEPDVYLKACQKLGADPDKTLVFEDVLQGIMAGKRAGMKVCCIYDPASDEKKQENMDLSDYYIDSFCDLEEVSSFEGI